MRPDVEAPEMNPRVFWPLAVLGWAVIAFGIYGLVSDPARTHPDQWVRWFVGAALAHDLVVAPLVFVVARRLRRLPATVRPFLQAGAIVSAVLVAVTFPFVAGYGQRANNPSALPNDYGIGLLVVLALVWATLCVVLLITLRKRR